MDVDFTSPFLKECRRKAITDQEWVRGFRALVHTIDEDGEGPLDNVLVLFGQRMRKVRLEKKVSQEKLAELAGLHRTYVSSVERGQRNISLLNIDKIASALGVSLQTLMPG
jgi:DNA-binding XRE family transcriptional regulator